MNTPPAHAFWITGPEQGEIRAETLTVPGPGEVCVRTLYTGVSRGSEALVFRGEVPTSEYARMRCPFQAGDFPAPVKYGYINVGIIEAGPATLLGRHIFCLYPHQSRYVVPQSSVYPLPDATPPARAVLAANLETALNGVWDAAPLPGDQIAVVGAGAVGCLTAWLLARIPGCRVELIDIDARRAEAATKLGARFRAPDAAASDADLVIHASGAPAGLALALRLAGFEARVVEMSWFGSRSVPLALGEGFHAKRLILRSSQVGQVATAQRARWTRRRRMALALELLSDPVLDTLITGESPFAELPRLMQRLTRTPGETICHRIRYPGTEDDVHDLGE